MITVDTVSTVADDSLDFDGILAQLQAREGQGDAQATDEPVDSQRDEPGYYESITPWAF